MTDRELLGAAARAAGLKVQIWDGHSGTKCAIDDGRHGRMWNPLTDDGDAIRLAVKLKLEFHFVNFELDDIWQVSVSYPNSVKHQIVTRHVIENCHIDDVDACTRRVIVRAAAEIGKPMPEMSDAFKAGISPMSAWPFKTGEQT